MSHRLECIAVFLSLALAAPACLATQVTLANGHIQLTVPGGWSRIMQSQGDPETMVFQVPDPADKNALARVTVTSQHVPNLVAFQQFVVRNSHHAHSLPHFKADPQRSTSRIHYYTADEGSVPQSYVEYYSFHRGYAVMVRCIRPTHGHAGAAWTTAFDKGCARVAASVK